ncbi:MAG: hypothetical protein DKM50_02555 [Candidatus Margulisiibacteriota bacterium]|nr:MAG: hypothetical protein DKM50_02555 [Candidatus Margulisiibacteriota bacterium]HCT86316.1 hypothetical protein [Candidatus Margulisiibacteriota bacterium]HCY38113.1 hypothetical protein [Candidatus Margulisiibacteriota bacterium]
MDQLDDSISKENILEFVSHNKKAIIVVVIVVICLVAAYIINKPKFRECLEINQNIKKYESLLADREKQVRNIVSEKKRNEDLAKNYENIRASFFTYNQAMEFVINDLTVLLGKSNLTFSSISIKPIKKIDKELYDFSVDIEVEGSYSHLRSFIVNLENSERAVFFDDFSLSIKTVSPLSLGTRLTLNLLVYK